MRTRSKKVILAAGMSLALAGVSACGSVGADGGKTTLDVLHKWPEPRYQDFWNGLEKRYEKKHPDVDVKLTAVGDQPIKDKLQVLAASDNLPDIYFSWAGNFTKKFVDAGLAADLTAELQGTEWGQRLAPAGIEAFTYNDKIHGVPIDLDAKFFVYNTEIFKQNNIEPPQTLDELYQACDALKGAGVQPIAFGNQFGWPAIHYLTSLMSSYVPTEVRKQDFQPETAKWTHPGYVQALTEFQTLSTKCFPKSVNGVPHDNAVAEVANGGAAMVYVQSLEFEKFLKENKAPEAIVGNWDFFKFPDVTGNDVNQNILTGAPDGLLVNSHSDDKETAIDFLKFLTNTENGKAMVAKMDRLSSVEGTATDENTFPQLQGALQEIQEADEFAIWLDTVTTGNVANAFLSGAQGLLSGKATPEQVMEKVRTVSKQESE
ncbi:ABC transporter substrate-binding protein [Arthrobacter pigmenti]